MYRFFETLPGIFTWVTLILIVLLSWQFPAFTALFIIIFDVYWLLKSIYLSLHLRVSMNAMKANLKIDWLQRLEKEHGDRWQELYHLVILPMYNEPYEVVSESFESLVRGKYPLDKMIVVLAIEERAGEEAKAVAEKIQEHYGPKFFKFLYTVHPFGIEGELPGKGSNQAWAGRRVKEQVIDPMGLDYKKILVSVFDVDTQVFPHYFTRLTYLFLTVRDPLRAIYQPVPLFTNNIYQAPALARVISFSCTFWQMMQQSRPERLTSFSSQSLPFQVLVDIGFWQTHMVSEDSRSFWQAFRHYHSDFRVEPLFYPVSMDANVTPKFWLTMKNLYKQQRRWAWGSENVPYLFETLATDPKIPRNKKWFWGFNTIEGYHSWSTNSLMIFALGWLPLMLGGDAFNETVLSYNLPNMTRSIIGISMLGVATSAIFSIMLLPPRPKWFRVWHYALYLLQWLLIPVTLIIFGSIPAIDAQTRLMLGGRFRLGFWVTPKGRFPKTVEG
jgi:cellulose synthase/poly-beta-1,6-N-acetylglucosamine synthase-like glycosyltransferase